MNELLGNSLFFGVTLTLVAYIIGLWAKKCFKLFIFNPLLVAIVICISVLLLLNVSYAGYNSGAKYLNYLLTPATVALAIPLYEQVSVLKKNPTAIFLGIFSGVVVSAVSIFAMSLLFGLSHTEYVTLLPKSITTAIGIALSEELGGYVSITVVTIILTGLFGNIAGDVLCRLCGVKNPVAKGVAIGTSTHVMGTAKAMEMGEVEGAMSSLSVAVAGCMTVVVAILFEGLI